MICQADKKKAEQLIYLQSQSKTCKAWNHTANVHWANTMVSATYQILEYHIYVDAVIRNKIFHTQNNEVFN